jgi:L-rhamnose mutarotase
MTSAPTETFEFCTHLAAGRERDYEHFHRAIPADLDRAMRDAGVLGWRIYRSGTTLTHVVEACDRARMEAQLSADPTNRAWQRQVAPFLAPTAEDDAAGDDSAADDPAGDDAVAAPRRPATRGELIWDLSWPTR